MTTYEAALADVMAKGGRKVTLAAAKPSPSRKVGKRKLPHPSRVKDEAVKAVTGKQPAKRRTGKPKATAAARRVTSAWPSAKGREVNIGDTVRTAEGVVLTVLSRWTRQPKSGEKIPCITGRIESVPAGAATVMTAVPGAGRKRGSGDRLAAESASLTHTKATKS
jgi:hypothetical protein